MHTALPRLAAALIAGSALLLVACGDQTTESAGATALATAAPADTPTTAAATTAAATTDEECTTALRMLEVATEAYFAENGVFPTSEAELVDVGYIREEAAAYDLVPDTGEVVRVPGVPCPADDEESDATESPDDGTPTVDSILAELGEDGVDLIGGPECAREFAEIALAGERFIAREGRDPESLDDLADDLAVEIVLWSFDAEAETLVPAEGSPCADVFGQSEASACDTERRTLEVAVEAYTAQYGEPPASEDALVPEFLREPIERYDLDADAAVLPAPGGPCGDVPVPTITEP